MKPATVSFKTVGCRLNQAETALIRAEFEAAGFVVVPFGNAAEVSVIHGCAVTANAEKDSLRLTRSARRASPSALIVLAGCVAETGGEACRQACGADLAVGQSDKFDLPGILSRRGLGSGSNKTRHPALPRFETTRALVKVQDGCDFHCAYCIVPRARGRPRSRPCSEILEEIAALGGGGYREVVLTGANTGCYDYDGIKLPDLLEQADRIPTVDRIRLSSIEVSTAEHAVIDFMAKSKKLCPFLHLPLQSGDDGILRAMGRRYDTEQYREIVAYAGDRLGGFGLGTDILIGFPGEDEDAFEATENLVKELPFSNIHVFTYSKRPDTPAAGIKDDVSAAVKKKRAARIRTLARLKRAAFAQSMTGKRVSVLIEVVDDKRRGTGWTGEYLKAIVEGSGLAANQLVEFIPERVEGAVLIGKAE